MQPRPLPEARADDPPGRLCSQPCYSVAVQACTTTNQLSATVHYPINAERDVTNLIFKPKCLNILFIPPHQDNHASYYKYIYFR